MSGGFTPPLFCQCKGEIVERTKEMMSQAEWEQVNEHLLPPEFICLICGQRYSPGQLDDRRTILYKGGYSCLDCGREYVSFEDAKRCHSNAGAKRLSPVGPPGVED